MKKLKTFGCLIVIVLLAGCATMPDFTTHVDPLTIFDEDAAVYAHIKIAGNEDILESLILQSVADIDEESLDIILERSHSLYIAVFDDKEPYVQLALQGSFPTFFVNASLNKSRGWQNESTSINGSTYKYKQYIGGIQLSTLSSNLIVLSTNNVSIMQDRFKHSNFNAMNFPTAYDENGLTSTINTLFMNSDSISLYFPKAESLVSSILQLPIDLAIVYAFGKITLIDDENFLLSIQLKMEDERVARGTMTLLRIALLGTNINAELLDDGIIALSDLPLNVTYLENIF